MGHYSAAEPLLRRSADIIRGSLGEHHPDLSDTLTVLASVEAALGRSSDAMKLFEQANAIDDRLIGELFAGITESFRMAFLKTLRTNFKVFLSILLQQKTADTTLVGKALDLVLRRKAIVAEAAAIQRDAVLGGKYPELKRKLATLIDLRTQVAKMTLDEGASGHAGHQEQLSALIGDTENLEAELVRAIPEMNLAERLRAPGARPSRSLYRKAQPWSSYCSPAVRFCSRSIKRRPALEF